MSRPPFKPFPKGSATAPKGGGDGGPRGKPLPKKGK